MPEAFGDNVTFWLKFGLNWELPAAEIGWDGSWFGGGRTLIGLFPGTGLIGIGLDLQQFILLNKIKYMQKINNIHNIIKYKKH